MKAAVCAGLVGALALGFTNPLGVGPDAGERAVAMAIASWPTSDGQRVEVEFQVRMDTRGTGMFDDARLAVGLRHCKRSACGDTTWVDEGIARDQFNVNDQFTAAHLDADVYGMPVSIDWVHPDGGDTTGDSRVQAFSPVLPHGQVRVFVRETRFTDASLTIGETTCEAAQSTIESWILYDGVVQEPPTGLPDVAPVELGHLFGVVACGRA